MVRAKLAGAAEFKRHSRALRTQRALRDQSIWLSFKWPMYAYTNLETALTLQSYLSSQLLNTFTFSRLTSTCASGAAGLSTVCSREVV